MPLSVFVESFLYKNEREGTSALYNPLTKASELNRFVVYGDCKLWRETQVTTTKHYDGGYSRLETRTNHYRGYRSTIKADSIMYARGITEPTGIKHRVRLTIPSKLDAPYDSVAPVRPGWKGLSLDKGDIFVPVKGDSVISERSYIGPAEFENSKFSRWNTPTGYWDSNAQYHALIGDFQGNISADVAVDANGAHSLWQKNRYTPYGAVLSENVNAPSNAY